MDKIYNLYFVAECCTLFGYWNTISPCKHQICYLVYMCISYIQYKCIDSLSSETKTTYDIDFQPPKRSSV